ncbi:MAG TPA: glycosyltransferase [Bacteroidales bacterium]|nr:glycosyltransferase [Bacteroidales bacterium]
MVRHIVIIGPAYPYRGGIAATNERLAQEFISSGVKVSIYTFSLQYPTFLFPGKTQYVENTKAPSFPVLRKINSINPFNWIKVGRELKKIKPDLVIVRYWIPFLAPALGTVVRKIKKNKFTKVIALVDNFIPHEKRPGDKMLSHYFMKAIDGCVVMSHSVKADIEKVYSSKPIEYCPHPLFDHYGKIIPKVEAKKALKLNPDKNYILFFGLVRDYKGLDLLIEAVSLTKSTNADYEVIVAGEFYSDEEKYYALMDKFNVRDKFRVFAQFIPDDLVPYFFCAADVIVQPYKDATQSGVTQVAYHFNKPMIVTNVGGLPEMVHHKKVGYVVAPNAPAIAQAIAKFYNENREKDFSAMAAIEKNKYSWKRMEETIYILFSKLHYNKKTFNG